MRFHSATRLGISLCLSCSVLCRNQAGMDQINTGVLLTWRYRLIFHFSKTSVCALVHMYHRLLHSLPSLPHSSSFAIMAVFQQLWQTCRAGSQISIGEMFSVQGLAESLSGKPTHNDYYYRRILTVPSELCCKKVKRVA